MSHTLEFKVTVVLERTQGKFAGRDEMADELTAVLNDSNPQSINNIGADGESDYEVTEWTVEPV